MKNIIIASTSTVHGSGFLDYLLEDLKLFFKSVSSIIFIPYARPAGITYDAYTEIVGKAFLKIGKTVNGIHEFKDPSKAIMEAKGIFIGGGKYPPRSEGGQKVSFSQGGGNKAGTRRQARSPIGWLEINVKCWRRPPAI